MARRTSRSSPQKLRPSLQDIGEASSRLHHRLNAYLAGLAARGDLGHYSGGIAAAEALIQSVAGPSPDITLRRIELGAGGLGTVLLAYADGLSDTRSIEATIAGLQTPLPPKGGSAWQNVLAALPVGGIQQEDRWQQLLTSLLSGMALLFAEGERFAAILDTAKIPARSVGRPQSEPSVKGPQEAFNGVLLTHIAQIRHRIHSPSLAADTMTIGSYTRTTVALLHIEGVTNPLLVEAVQRRLRRINRDYVQNCNEIAPYIHDNPKSLFPQARQTERVDWAVRDLLNGKVIVMVDGDPFVLILPITLMDLFQTSQDYVFSTWESSLVRIVRFFGVLLGLYLMPLYIAIFSVNVDLVPTKLVLTVAGSRQNLPFPPALEVLIMWVIIEVLREAANRLPQALATTLGTVGAVVVGTAIVKAGIVDPIMIVLVTLSAVGLFTLPTYELGAALRWLFWVLVLGAVALGFLGVVLVSVGVVGYLCSLENFGVPYMSPFAPLQERDLGDALARAPIPSLRYRPTANYPLDTVKAAPMARKARVSLRRGGTP